VAKEVLKPDAITVDGRLMFLTDLASITRHRTQLKPFGSGNGRNEPNGKRQLMPERKYSLARALRECVENGGPSIESSRGALQRCLGLAVQLVLKGRPQRGLDPFRVTRSTAKATCPSIASL
jgi:hypothetical protein